jgi:hypothetical protein
MTTQDEKKMEIETLESFPAGGNPSLYDKFHMGTYVSSNVLIMHKTFEHERADYIIICNVETGQRIKVRF